MFSANIFRLFSISSSYSLLFFCSYQFDIIAYLRCFAHEKPKSWHHFLAWADYSFNMGYHSSTDTTPFQIVYGREPPAPPDCILLFPERLNLLILKKQLLHQNEMLK